MKSHRLFAYLLPVALTGLLVAGCNKNAQPSSETSANAPAQTATPAPPADQAGAASSANKTPARSSRATSANAPARAQNTPPPAPAPPPPLVIPAGTHLSVTTGQSLGSKISEDGETFTATVARAVVVDGQTAIPQGASATGTVVDAKALGRFKGGAHLELRLDTVQVNGTTYQVQSSALERAEAGKGKRSAGFIGGGAGLGALIGGLAGGGKGALIGGLVGGGAGTAGAGLTGKKDIYIPAESTLTFRLTNPVQIAQ